MRSSSRPSSSAMTAKVLSPRSMPTGDGALPVVRHRSRCRGKAWTFRLTRQRPPSRVLTVANRIFALSFLSIRRNRRVHSRTRRLPSFGKRTTRACSPSPTRIAAAFPAPLFRSRNACRAVALRLNLGNLGFFPARSPLRPLEKASSARPRSTAASSNTCWHTSARQTSPGLASSTPAAVERFQALNEGEARGAHVAPERLLLLVARQQRETKRRVPAHARHPDNAIWDAPSATNPRYELCVLS